MTESEIQSEILKARAAAAEKESRMGNVNAAVTFTAHMSARMGDGGDFVSDAEAAAYDSACRFLTRHFEEFT